MNAKEIHELTSPEAVKLLLTKPQSYGNGYQCCKQMIALAGELRQTRARADHSGEHLEEFNEAIRKILHKAGFPDLPSWLEAHKANVIELAQYKHDDYVSRRGFCAVNNCTNCPNPYDKVETRTNCSRHKGFKEECGCD